ncbi:hypothetical protein OIU78_007298 [Salix suchowensis]|nr:hypothetical protein OIU78_007298 [Salix suchowensis]
MERNSLSSDMSGPSLGSRASNNNEKKKKKKKTKLGDSWSFSSCQSYGHDDYPDGLSWPPRSYTCSFCKREFKSAQALGGHMNVHRRDRARLRLSPPRDDQCPILTLNLYPNPSFLYSIQSHNPIFGSPLKTPMVSHDKMDFKIWNKAEIVRLDLEIGLLSDSKDDLDLELRLGSLN